MLKRSVIIPAARQPQQSAVLAIWPMILVSFCFVLIPLAVTLFNSVTALEDGHTALSLINYRHVLSDSYYWEILFRTLRVSAFTTGLSLLLGYPAALYLYFSKSRWRRVFLFIIVSPLFISVVVRTYGWMVLLGNDGPINAVLPFGHSVRLLHTEGAIVLGLMHVYMPFMVLSLNASLTKVDRSLLNAAATLGASGFRIFRDVLLPLSVPGILSGCMVVFAISMTAFSTPVLLGGAPNKTMPYLVYQQNLLLSDWHLGSALAFLLLTMTLIGVWGLRQAAQRASTRSLI